MDSDVHINYNLLRMEADAVWQGSLDLSQTKYQQYRGEGEPFIDGEPMAGLDTWHWSYENKPDSLNSVISHRSPLPREWLDFHGHYKQGNNIVLSYSIMGREILEYPQLIQQYDKLILSHTLHIGPGTSQDKIYVGKLKMKQGQPVISGILPAGDGQEEIKPIDSASADGNLIVSAIYSQGEIVQFVAIGINESHEDYRWVVDELNSLILNIPESSHSNQVQVFRYTGNYDEELRQFARFIEENAVPENIPEITDYIQGGPAVWSQKVTTRSKMDVGRPHFDPIYYGDDDMMTNEDKHVEIPDDYPYVVDELTLPFENPWNSWIRPSGLDFLSDGRMIMPDTFDQPVVWIPQKFDNSPGGGVWSDTRWGPLGDRFIHTSFGKGWLYYMITQEVDGIEQGALISLPFQLDSGVQRVCVNPADGQIYTAGLTGWDDGFATKYGAINRIRYTGGEGRVIEDVKVRPNGLEFTFNFKPDEARAIDSGNYDIVQYNYMWRQNYGSEKWSVEEPFLLGPDKVDVKEVELTNNGHTVL